MKGSTILRRALALVLTVVMLVSCWVFTANAASNTAYSGTAGTYQVKISYCVDDGRDGYGSNEFNYANWKKNKDKDNWNCVGIIVVYKGANGTGTEDSSAFNMKSTMNCSNGTSGTKTFNNIGFPTQIILHNDNDAMTGIRKAQLSVSKVEIRPNGSGSYQTLWTGKMWTDSTNKNKYCWIKYDGTNDGNDSSNGVVEETSGGWSLPAPQVSDCSMGTYTKAFVKNNTPANSTNYLEVSNSATTNTLLGSFTYPTTVKDQYGVAIGGTLTPKYSIETRYRSNSTSWSSTTDTAAYGINTSTGTLTASKAAGYTYHYCTVQAHLTWSLNSTDYLTDTKVSAGFKFPTYTVKYNYYTTEIIENTDTKMPADNPTKEYIPYKYITVSHSTTGSARYGDAPSTNPPTPDDAVKYYFNDNTHWYQKDSWEKPTSVTTDPKTVLLWDASGSSAAHSWNGTWQSFSTAYHGFSPEDFHRQYCNVYADHDRNGEHYKFQWHQWDAGTVTQAATCMAAGNMRYTCTSCGKTKDVSIPINASNHDYGDWEQFLVTIDGEEVYSPTQHRKVCSRNASHIDYQDHDWKKMEDGETDKWIYDSERPGDNKTPSGRHYLECNTCGYKLYENHSDLTDETTHKFVEDAEAYVEPTCTSTGSRTYRCNAPGCGYFYTVTIDALDHDLGAMITTDPTNHYQYCSRCKQNIGVTAHTWDNVNFAPTTGAEASTHTRTCSGCGRVETAAHTFDKQTVKNDSTKFSDANCTYATRYKYTCECGQVSKTDIYPDPDGAPLNEGGHTLETVIPSPEDGSSNTSVTNMKYRHCTLCNKCWPIMELGGKEVDTSDETDKDHYIPDGYRNVNAILSDEGVNTNLVTVPSPTFNNFQLKEGDSKRTVYSYSERKAAIRLNSATGQQEMRFSGSVELPKGVSYAGMVPDRITEESVVGGQTKINPKTPAQIKSEAEADDSIPDVVLDFGFVLTLDTYLDGSKANSANGLHGDLNNLVINPSNTKIARMSVPATNAQRGNTAAFGDGSNWSGVSVRDDKPYEGATNYNNYLTFNLLVSVMQKNWTKDYIARPYIIYKYHGHVYTVYDGFASAKDNEGNYIIGSSGYYYSRRSVLSIAKAVHNYEKAYIEVLEDLANNSHDLVADWNGLANSINYQKAYVYAHIIDPLYRDSDIDNDVYFPTEDGKYDYTRFAILPTFAEDEETACLTYIDHLIDEYGT